MLVSLTMYTPSTIYCDITGNLSGSAYEISLVSPPSSDTKKQWSTLMELMKFFHRVARDDTRQGMYILLLMYSYIEQIHDHIKAGSILVESPKIRVMICENSVQVTRQVLTGAVKSEEDRKYFLKDVLPQMNRTVALLRKMEIAV